MQSRKVQDIGLIFFLAVLTYSPSLTADFTFDDRPAILENNDVTEDVTVSNFTDYLRRISRHDFWGANITDHSTSHKSYRPLTVLSFKLDHFIQKVFRQASKQDGTVSPTFFHANNILLHALNSILFYAFIDKNINLFIPTNNPDNRKSSQSVDSSRTFCFISAVIFAIHPVHTESIAGIVGRADLLYSWFVMLALLIHHHISSPFIGIVAGIIANLSVWSKEQGIILLPLIIIHRILRKISSKKSRTKTELLIYFVKQKSIFVYAFTLLLILYGRFWIMDFRAPTFQEGDNPTAFISGPFLRFLNYSYIYWINLWILLSPNWLCFDWSMGCLNYIRQLDLNSTFQTQTMHKLLMVISFWSFITILSLRALVDMYNPKQSKTLKVFSNGNKSATNSVAVFLALTLLTLPFIPASNMFFTVGFVIAERNLYLSVGGFALLIAIGYQKLSKYLKSNNKISRNYFVSILKVGMFSLIAIFVCKSFVRSYEWKNEDVLYRSGLKVCPKNSKIHYNIAKLAQQSQETNNMAMKYHHVLSSDLEAIRKTTAFDWREDKNELRFDPETSAYSFINAESFVVMLYRTSIYLWPEYEHALNNLANVLRKRPQKYFHLEAKDLLTRALKINSKFSAAWMNLGIVQAQLDELEEAEASYHNAISLRNHFYPDGHFNLGTLYLKLENKKEEALSEFTLSISQNKQHFSAWSNKVILLDELNRLEEAQGAAEKAKLIFPKKAEFYFHLGNILGKQGKFVKAEENYYHAIEILNSETPPKHPKTKSLYYSNLGVLYHRWKKDDYAIQNYKRALILDNKNHNARDNLDRLLKSN